MDKDRLEFLCTAGRQIILKYLPTSSCLTSTRIATHFLDAVPVPVYTMVISPTETKLIGRGAIPTDGWNGHIVAVDRKEMLDLSSDQFGFPALRLPIDDVSFWRGIPQGYVIGDSQVFYWRDWNCQEYKTTSTWVEDWKNIYREIEEAWQAMNR